MSGALRAEHSVYPHSAGQLARVVFVNRFAPPDLSATSQLLGDLAQSLPAAWEIVLLSSAHSYSTGSRLADDAPAVSADAAASSRSATGQSRAAGSKRVTVVHLRTSRFGRKSLLRRAMDYVSFHVSAGRWLWKHIRADDVVVVLTDPPLISVTAAIAVKLRGATLVNWIQDLFPEVAMRLREPRIIGLFSWPLRVLRDWSLRVATVNVAIGDGMAQFLKTRGLAEEQLRCIPNWAHGEAGQVSDGPNPVRTRLGLTGSFVVMYAGNLGRAHDATTFLDAATRLGDHDEIVFLILGDGHANAWLRSQARSRGLGNLRFEPYQPLASLGDTLAAGELHLVSLRPELEGLIVPSKFYGIAAAARPSAFVGDPDGELARIIRRGDCGFVVAQGDGLALAEGILALHRDRARAGIMGLNARTILEREFSRADALQRWSDLLTFLRLRGPRTASTQQERSSNPS